MAPPSSARLEQGRSQMSLLASTLFCLRAHSSIVALRTLPTGQQMPRLVQCMGMPAHQLDGLWLRGVGTKGLHRPSGATVPHVLITSGYFPYLSPYLAIPAHLEVPILRSNPIPAGRMRAAGYHDSLPLSEDLGSWEQISPTSKCCCRSS